MGEKRNAYRILVGEPEGQRPLGRTVLLLGDFHNILNRQKNYFPQLLKYEHIG
jgi:hypothetical protein